MTPSRKPADKHQPVRTAEELAELRRRSIEAFTHFGEAHDVELMDMDGFLRDLRAEAPPL